LTIFAIILLTYNYTLFIGFNPYPAVTTIQSHDCMLNS